MKEFFRKLRQELLSENRFSKYLIYAIGEIVLVMIGILLALQVNNWNENRKTENNVQASLMKLKDDIQNDIEYLRKLDNEYSEWHAQGRDIQTVLIDRSKNKLTKLSEFLIGRGSMNQLCITRNTFDQMKIEGLLYRIRNPGITKSIEDYYSFAAVEIEKVNLDNQEFYRYVLNSSGYEYIVTNTRLVHRSNLEYVDWSWLQDPASERYKKFEGRISFHMLAIEMNKLLINALIEKGENVLKAIQS
ncbi:MAG: hypothetical protein IPL46_13775 [Saprospiraceae bacterium]|nr:hypothetical protein [Saprospiraceae bacterium]